MLNPSSITRRLMLFTLGDPAQRLHARHLPQLIDRSTVIIYPYRFLAANRTNLKGKIVLLGGTIVHAVPQTQGNRSRGRSEAGKLIRGTLPDR